MINKLPRFGATAFLIGFTLIIAAGTTRAQVAALPVGVPVPLAVPCIGAITQTYTPPAAAGAPASLLVEGDACNNSVDLDIVLAAYPAVATKIEVKLKDGDDTFKSSGHPGMDLIVHGGAGKDVIMVGGVGVNVFNKVDLFGNGGDDHLVLSENPGQSVGGNGNDRLDSGEPSTAGPNPTHNLIAGTTAGPSDGSVDQINCFDGPLAGGYFISADPAEGDTTAGC